MIGMIEKAGGKISRRSLVLLLTAFIWLTVAILAVARMAVGPTTSGEEWMWVAMATGAIRMAKRDGRVMR